MTTRHIAKNSITVEASGWLSFPIPALREAIVHAIYHRSYESSVEPTKAYLYPDCIEVISYPGPVPGIEQRHLDGVSPVPPVPSRNGRIGEFLKELRLAEARGTGLTKIRKSLEENGSSRPTFDSDEQRTYFRVTLPAHPEYVALGTLRDYHYYRSTGNQDMARSTLEKGWMDGVRSPMMLVALIRERTSDADFEGAEALLEELRTSLPAHVAPAIVALAEAYADVDERERSRAILDRLPSIVAARESIEAANLERRLGREDRAHALFSRAKDIVQSDVRGLHEFAQSKLALTGDLKRSKRPADQETRSRLLKEAMEPLERVTSLAAPQRRHAWAWFHLGQARDWSGAPLNSVLAAYRNACDLDPASTKFKKPLSRAESRDPTI